MSIGNSGGAEDAAEMSFHRPEIFLSELSEWTLKRISSFITILRHLPLQEKIEHLHIMKDSSSLCGVFRY